jgi:hypothetical protein
VTDAARNDTLRSVAVGAGVGAAVTGLAALLVGAVAFAIPGVGPVLAMGPLAAALTAAVGGGLVGGLAGLLVSEGVPAEDADVYAERVRAGAYLVLVQCEPAVVPRVAEILTEAGAEGPIRRAAEPAR